MAILQYLRERAAELRDLAATMREVAPGLSASDDQHRLRSLADALEVEGILLERQALG